MGVMGCNRTGCDNIMCNHHIKEQGYICYECLDGLRDYLKSIPDRTTKHVKSFMEIPKRLDEDIPDVDQYIKTLDIEYEGTDDV